MSHCSVQFLPANVRVDGDHIVMTGHTLSQATPADRLCERFACAVVSARVGQPILDLLAQHPMESPAEVLGRCTLWLTGSWRKTTSFPLLSPLSRPVWVLNVLTCTVEPQVVEERFLSFYRFVCAQIEGKMRIDPTHKIDEGHTEIRTVFPNMFSEDQRVRFEVSVYCYTLGPGRQHSWTSTVSIDDAMAQAKRDLTQWLIEAQEDDNEDLS